MSLWKEYIVAKSIDESLAALAAAPGPAHPVAGGTDLLIELQQNRRPPIHTLVDISQIPELNCLELRGLPAGVLRDPLRSATGRIDRGDFLFIGAAVPVSVITTSPLVHEHALAVSEACGLIGGPQVRNTATLGGNVAHALPAADGMIALCALDAQAEVASAAGLTRQPVLSLFRGPGVSALEPDKQILTGFYLPIRQAGQASAFLRVMRPQGVALPIINTAVWLQRAGERIADIRILFGPAGPVPQRAHDLEKLLAGAVYGPQIVAEAQECLQRSLHFRSSPQRGGAEYRYQLSESLLEDVIGTAWKRAEVV